MDAFILLSTIWPLLLLMEISADGGSVMVEAGDLEAVTIAKRPVELMTAGNSDWERATSAYEFSAKNITGEEISLDKYRGHVLLIVNVASECRLTQVNYDQLFKLDKEFRERGLRVLAFPTNQFGDEPGTESEIAKFTQTKRIQFDIFAKIDVNGKNAHPLWKWLKKQDGKDEDINWNFVKFLTSKAGKVVSRYSSTFSEAEQLKTFKRLASTIDRYL